LSLESDASKRDGHTKLILSSFPNLKEIINNEVINAERATTFHLEPLLESKIFSCVDSLYDDLF